MWQELHLEKEERNRKIGEGNMAVRIRTTAIEEIEEIVGGRVVEVELAPELRSTTNTTKAEDIAETKYKAIIINRLVERQVMGSKESEETTATKAVAGK